MGGERKNGRESERIALRPALSWGRAKPAKKKVGSAKNQADKSAPKECLSAMMIGSFVTFFLTNVSVSFI